MTMELHAARLEDVDGIVELQRAGEAYYFTNARNVASIELHRRWGFTELARASELHGTAFAGGTGILFRAALVPPPDGVIPPTFVAELTRN